MPPKPSPKIAEPVAGYAEVAVRTEKTGVAFLTAEQQAFLREAMLDFEELEEEAQEAGLPPPASRAKEAALLFLHKAIREAPLPYALGMWEKGAVVVCTQTANKFRIDAFFDADGGASFHVSYPEDEKHEYRQYALAAEVANEWVFGILRRMQG